MSGGERVLVVNQYFRPDLASSGHYAAGICDGLAEQGFSVDVVAAQPCYTPDAPAAPSEEVLESGVRVHRVGMRRTRGRERPLKRFGGYARFMAAGWRKARSVTRARRPDAVLSFHNPPFVGLIGASISDRMDIPFLYSPFDLLPESVRHAGWNLPEFAFAVWDRVNDRIHGRADRILVLGTSMAERMREKVDEPGKIVAVQLWARPELDRLPDPAGIRQELGVGAEELLVLYAGNMGYQHAVAPVLEAAARLQHRPVRFVFLGRGPERKRAKERARSESLRNVQFLDYQPERRFRRILAASDVGVVALKEDMEHLCYPSRSLTFLSAGLPILAFMAPEADIARVVREGDCGWVVGDAAGCAQLLEELSDAREAVSAAGERALATYQRRFGRGRTVDAYGAALREVLATDGDAGAPVQT